MAYSVLIERLVIAGLAGAVGFVGGAVTMSEVLSPVTPTAPASIELTAPIVHDGSWGSDVTFTPRSPASALPTSDDAILNVLPTSQADCDRMGVRLHFKLTYAGSGNGCTGSSGNW